MTVQTILDDLQGMDIKLTVQEDRLMVDAPKGTMTAALQDAIRQHKDKLLELLSTQVPTVAVPTIDEFVEQCLTFDLSASTLGAELMMALSCWRRHVKTPDRTCQWNELQDYLEAHGCRRDALISPATWQGVALKPEGLHTIIPSDHHLETCQECNASDIFAKGPVRVCKSCRHEWLLKCKNCNGDKWDLIKSCWVCSMCGYAWEPYIDLRQDVPHALTTVEAVDGRQFTLGIYKCPGCDGINWGPQVDDPETWHCLDCNGLE